MHESRHQNPAFTIRPLATFSGLRGVPILATSHNSLFPSLSIGPEGLVIRVIRWHRFAADEIEAISLRKFLGYQITFVPRTGIRTFTVAFAGKADTVRTLTALQSHAGALAPSVHALLQRMEG
jgi:hypothetical protein